MKVEANGTIYDIELPEDGMRLRFKEADAAEKAVGGSLENARPLQAAAAIVWTLVKRQDPTVRFDAIDFDMDEFNVENATDEDVEDDAAVPPVEANDSEIVASDM